jgi:phosphatidylinositol kinase/protein kinase (PI-3  family)
MNDDLRQDQLVLQMLRIMDSIWLSEGLDLHVCPFTFPTFVFVLTNFTKQLSIYSAMATDSQSGMVEIVGGAKTVAAIQIEAGGVTAAFKQTPLFDWLQGYHTAEDFELVVENFTLSCAGYVVGTYVLGIFIFIGLLLIPLI